MKSFTPLSLVVLLATAYEMTAAAAAGAECAVTNEEVATLAVKTEVVAHPLLEAPALAFSADSDPNTLEIVFLEKRGEKSYVSQDGEVIFIANGTNDRKQQKLITQALAIKVILRKAATTGCSLPG